MSQLPLYTHRRLHLSDGRQADFILAERADTLNAAHGAAAEWRAITNGEGLSFFCRVEIVPPTKKGGQGYYNVWVGPQQRSQRLLHLPNENIERRNGILKAHLTKRGDKITKVRKHPARPQLHAAKQAKG